MRNLVKVKLNRNTQQRKLKKLRTRWNKHINIFIGKRLTKYVEELFFGEERNHDDGSITVHYKGDPWLSGVMRDVGIFESTSEAKGAGWHKKAEKGFWHEIITVANIPHNVCIFKEEEGYDIKKETIN